MVGCCIHVHNFTMIILLFVHTNTLITGHFLGHNLYESLKFDFCLDFDLSTIKFGENNNPTLPK